MQESLQLFEKLHNSRWFVNTHFVVVFTKLDLFKEKLARIPLERYFPSHRGGLDVNKAVRFIEMMFVDATKASCWGSFTSVVADLSTEEGMRPFWRTFESAIKREPGHGGGLDSSTDLFAVVVLICDQYLRPRYNKEQNSVLRFFRMASLLPMELEMILCNRAGGFTEDTISGFEAEKSIIKVFKFFS